ncbi:MerR family transcriptional regulator [Isobaculum melis]|uniref:DNA-binding transcriptional regulator, MerR family n=1 Tax=Isobaculum melis TaxID=142588 RepID=A0A1H9RKK3_9LACT|nr:MerR family transcriptional regulator [Isobaculum melis]SER73194.1 DNA-binding transcriptional regulator, MerR family [Isobaculum melis]
MKKTIKETAKRLNLRESTLRYYDKMHLLSPRREANGYRIYEEIDLLTLKYILVMKYGEFQIEEIQLVLSAMSNIPTAECIHKTEKLLALKKATFKEKIHYYQHMLHLIEEIPEMNAIDAETESKIDDYVEKIYASISLEGEE